MRRYRNLRLVLFAVVPLLVLVSCGGKDDKTPTGTDPIDLPTIPAAQVTADVDFHSTDPTATTAQSMVAGQLTMVNGFAGMGQAFTGPLAGADWHDASGDCYDWSYGSAGCAYQYLVCKVAQTYEWSLTVDGTCGGDVPFVDWIAFAGTTSIDGTTGTMLVFTENSTTVGAAWQWATAVAGNSGTWSFYSGAISEQTLTATLEWLKNNDGSEVTTWVAPGDMKWETRVNPGGDSGWMNYYAWDDVTSVWDPAWEIAWNADGTGSWIYYDADGNVSSETAW